MFYNLVFHGGTWANKILFYYVKKAYFDMKGDSFLFDTFKKRHYSFLDRLSEYQLKYLHTIARGNTII